VTAYTLTSTAFIPAYGQIADTFGRHIALQSSMAFMLIGSILCAVAPDWGVLLFGRALQGLSAAGIMNIIKIILADKVTLAEQSKNSTIFAFVNGISYAVGPVIGGSLANSNWRYCFVVSIPITVIAQVLIFFVLRKELVHGTHHLTGPERKSFMSGLSTIDVGGTILFIFGAGLMILGTSWGGSKYSWSSYHVLVPLVIGAVLFVLFFVYEYLLEPGKIINRLFPRQVAMIPWKLFERRDVISLCIVNAATGAALYSAFYFVGIFWTLVQSYSPAKAGYQLLYYTPGIGIGVYSAMFMCNFFPRQTFYPIFIGSVVEATGFAVLAWATSTRKSALVSVMMAISGGGTGLRFMPNTLHAAGVWPTRLAAVMSLMDFALPFGGTLAIAIMSAVFYNKFDNYLNGLGAAVGQAASGASAHNKTQSLQGIASLPLEIQDLVRQKAARSVMWSFISVLPLMGLSVAAASVLGNVWIKPKAKVGGEESHGAIIYSSYIAAVVTVSATIQTEFHVLTLSRANLRHEKFQSIR
jgi:MFS family permease